MYYLSIIRANPAKCYTKLICVYFHTIPIPPPPGQSQSSPAPSDQAISFFANGDSTYVTAISVDTGRDVGFAYPKIIIRGTANIPSKQDTLTFMLQFDNANNTLTSCTQFIGNFNDTSRSYHTSTLDLNSQVNYNAYEDSWSGAEVLYVDILTNDGKMLTATFYGSLLAIANNTGAPPTLPITNGNMKIDLP
jgi:hypothetical protein